MWVVGVLEKPESGLCAALASALAAGGIEAVCLPAGAALPTRLDVAVWGGGGGADIPPCQAAVLSGGHEQLPAPDAACVVTCGLSHQDSLTPSSVVDHDLSLALQREIMTLAGARLERQEILLTRPSFLSLDNTMALTAALLVLGVSPGEVAGLVEGAKKPSGQTPAREL